MTEFEVGQKVRVTLMAIKLNNAFTPSILVRRGHPNRFTVSRVLRDDKTGEIHGISLKECCGSGMYKCSGHPLYQVVLTGDSDYQNVPTFEVITEVEA